MYNDMFPPDSLFVAKPATAALAAESAVPAGRAGALPSRAVRAEQPDTAVQPDIPAALRPVEEGPVVPDSALQIMGRCFDSWHEAVWVEDSLRLSSHEYFEKPCDGRQAGDPLSFRLVGDDGIAGSLLLLYLLVVLLVSRFRHSLHLRLKAFFQERLRENMFDASFETLGVGNLLFPFALCFSLGLLIFDYQRVVHAEFFAAQPPYGLLAADVGACLLAYLLRTLLYLFVNHVFFDHDSNARWREAYRFSTVTLSLLLLHLVLLVVFYEMDFKNWLLGFGFSVVLVEMCLIYKTYRIFFGRMLGYLHLILYFCALEILPLFSAWKGVRWMMQELALYVQ